MIDDDDSVDDDSTDSLEFAIGSVETAVKRVETAVERVETAVEQLETAVGSVGTAVARVETAIKDKWTTVHWVGIMVIGALLWSLPGTIWHAKWRYAATYDIPSSQVYVQAVPHDCAFFAAPLGEKYCHYDRTVSITRWSTSQTSGNPIISYDDGKTWSSFDAGGEKVPQYSTVKAVFIGWEKKED
jgi:hypothetical protein